MKRIIIAEDDPIIRLELSQTLSELGYEVIGEAEDGFDAVKLCEQYHPDIVLMDVKMPVFDGLSAAETIISESTAGCIVLLTAYSDKTIVESAKKIGVTAYLTKPLNSNSILPTLELAFAQSQRLRESQKETIDAQKKINEDRYIRKAQMILARKRKCSEGDAYRWMRKAAMDKRVSLAVIADAIIFQEERSNVVASVKRDLMEKYGISEEKAFQRIASLAKGKGISVEEAALLIKEQVGDRG